MGMRRLFIIRKDLHLSAGKLGEVGKLLTAVFCRTPAFESSKFSLSNCLHR